MSLVVAHVGWDYITLGADRGSWDVGPDGAKNPSVMQRSKIHAVPGVPAVIAITGTWHLGWIEEWIRSHPQDPRTFSLPDFAKAFVADYFAYHDPIARARLAQHGLTMPADGKLKPHTTEIQLASADVFVAGLDDKDERGQLWHAEYPQALKPHHFRVETHDGELRRIETGSWLSSGACDPLRPLIETLNPRIDRTQSSDVVYALLNLRERMAASEQPATVLAPLDVVRVTRDGVEWLNGSEGANAVRSGDEMRAIINPDGSAGKDADWLPESSTRKYAAESGADITRNHTANDTANVNGVGAATISQGASRANAAIGSNNNVNYANMSSEYQTNYNVQGSLKSTQSMRSTAVSIPVVSSSGITYTSSTGSTSTGSSTITLYWDGTNGSVVPQVHFPSDAYNTWTNCVAGNSGALTGFNASTTYYFMARINATALTLQVQQQQGGSTANGVDHQWLNADGFVSYAVNMACSTPAVNTGGGGGTPPGGGGGGTSCPATDQILETKRGLIKAGEIIAGDFVRDPDGGWNEVFVAEDRPAQIVAVTIAGEELRVDSQHLWLSPDGEWIGTMDLHLRTLLESPDKSLKAVEGLRLIGPGTMRKLKVERQRFVIGAVVGHNATTL